MDDDKNDIKLSPSSEQTVNAEPSGRHCIYRIPCDHPGESTKAYEPQVISLGPLHSGKSDLATYEAFKKGLLSQIYPHRARGILHGQELRSKVGRLRNLRQRMIEGPPPISSVREWYEPPIPKTDEQLAESKARECNKWPSPKSDIELAELMARDGLVLLQFLREISQTPESNFASTGDYNVARLFRASLLAPAVQQDIMRLENQIPLFALKTIHKWETETWQDMIAHYKPGNKSFSRLMLQDLSLQLEAGVYQDPISNLRNSWHTLSPFQAKDGTQNSQVSPVAEHLDLHLLGFVYKNIIRSSDSGEGNKNISRKKNSLLLQAKAKALYDKLVNIIRCSSREKKDSLPLQATSGENKDSPLPQAKVLYDKGVNFAALEDPYPDKICFDSTSCTYYLPAIKMNDITEAVMRNLMAFEATLHEKESKPAPVMRNLMAFEATLHEKESKPAPLMRYVYLMHNLIRGATDVEVLKHRHILIISDSRTNEEVLHVWNGLGKGLAQCAYEPIDKSIAGVVSFNTSIYRIFRLRVICRVIFRDFKKRYFSNPWIAISLIVGCVLFLIAVAQTVLAALQL